MNNKDIIPPPAAADMDAPDQVMDGATAVRLALGTIGSRLLVGLLYAGKTAKESGISSGNIRQRIMDGDEKAITAAVSAVDTLVMIADVALPLVKAKVGKPLPTPEEVGVPALASMLKVAIGQIDPQPIVAAVDVLGDLAEMGFKLAEEKGEDKPRSEYVSAHFALHQMKQLVDDGDERATSVALRGLNSSVLIAALAAKFIGKHVETPGLASTTKFGNDIQTLINMLSKLREDAK